MARDKLASGASQEYAYFKLDKRWWFVIWFTMTIQGIILSIAYAMAAFMIRSLYPDATEARIGRLTGLLAATFPCAAFPTQYGWGMLSDRIGRKPVLMIGVFFTALSTLMFGLADSFAMAVTARVVGGLFSSTGVCMKSICAEAWDTTSQAKALGIMSLGWTMGSTLGPAFGGALSEPCIVFGPGFPFCGPHGLFRLRPYALGCIAASSLATLSLLGCLFTMPETHPRYRKPVTAYKPLSHDSHPGPDQDADDSDPAELELELAAVPSLGPRKSGPLASPSKGTSRGWGASPAAPSSPAQTPGRLSWHGRECDSVVRLTSSELSINSQMEGGIDAGRSSLDWAASSKPYSPARGPARGPPRDSMQSLHSQDSGSLMDRAKSSGSAGSLKSREAGLRMERVKSASRADSPKGHDLASPMERAESSGNVVSRDLKASHQDGLQPAEQKQHHGGHSSSGSHMATHDSLENTASQHGSSSSSGGVSKAHCSPQHLPESGPPRSSGGLQQQQPQQQPEGKRGQAPQMPQPAGDFVDQIAHTEGQTCSTSDPSLVPLIQASESPQALQEQGFSLAGSTRSHAEPSLHTSPQRDQDVQPSSRADSALAGHAAACGHLDSSGGAWPAGNDGAGSHLVGPDEQAHAAQAQSSSDSQGWDDDRAGHAHYPEARPSWWARLWPFRQRQPRSTNEAEYTQLLHQQRPSDSRDGSRQQSSQGDSQVGSSTQGSSDSEGHAAEAGHDLGSKKPASWDPETGEQSPAMPPEQTWWKQRKVLLSLFLYLIVVFFCNMLEELTPIYASAPTRQGGLGLPLSLLAWPLTVSGGVLVVFTLYGYPSLQARVGVLACCGLGILLNIPAALVMPLPSLVLSIRWLFWVLIYGGSLLKAVAKLLALTPSTILINQAAPRSQIGAVNGAGNTLGSFSRAAGPALAGIIWGQMAELHFWGHQFVPFGVVGGAAAISWFWLFFMQRTAHVS